LHGIFKKLLQKYRFYLEHAERIGIKGVLDFFVLASGQPKVDELDSHGKEKPD
jgi:hypothetical protein